MAEGAVAVEQPERQRLAEGPSLPYALGWAVMGLEASLLLLFRGDARITARLIAAAWNVGQATALGLISAWAIAAYLRFGSKKVLVRAADAFGIALAVGMLVLPDDVGGLAGMLGGERWVSVVQLLLIGVVAAAVPFAALVGRALARRSQRIVGMGLAVFIGAAHASVLAGLYPGVHAFAAWTGAVLFGASLQGANELESLRGRIPLRWRAAAYVLVAELAAFSVLLPPPARALVQLVRFPGAVAAPHVTRLYPRQRRRGATVDSEWFRPRRGHPPVPPTGVRLLPPNSIVVLLTGECLRADLLEREELADKLPNLWRLAREGVHFANARSTSPSTGPTIAAIFSGRYYSQLYWTPSGSGERVTVFAREDTTPRFPFHLQAGGVHTLNMVGQRTMANVYGHVGGFAEEVRVTGRGWAKPLVDTILARVTAQSTQPLFVYGHFKEGHYPYRGRGATDWDRYISHLGRVDHEIGRLLDLLQEPQFGERVALILTADHGEAFGEHGMRFHGTTVYEELLHVTFLARVPGVAPRREERLVSTIDLGPTILDLFGLPTPGHHMGQSLVPYMLGRPGKLTRPIVADSGRLLQAMYFEDNIKIIYDKRLGTSEIYDLSRDPGELETLSDARPELYEERLEILHAFFEAHQLRRRGYTIPFRP